MKIISLLLAVLSFSLIAEAQGEKSSDLSPVIALDKLNVLYIGVDNPVSIAVPGYKSEKISVTISDSSTIQQTAPGNYVVRVTLVGKTEIKVYVTMPDGSKKYAGSKLFRNKRIPNPVPMVGGDKGGAIKQANFSVQKGIAVVLEDFEYDLKFEVVSFEMSYASPNQDLISLSTNGPLFSEQMLRLITNCKPGDNFFFDNIRVRTPDGMIRQTTSMVFKII